MKREERKKITKKKLIPDPCSLIPRICFLIVFFVSVTCFIFARGATDEEEIQTQNNEWILCITEFDLSSLPAGRLLVADLISRKLVETISGINYRTRISPEYAYYEEVAWSKARSTAAKALANKHDERSALLYRGDRKWKYTRDLKRVEEEIEKLRINLEEIENNKPIINTEPNFALTPGNLNLSFPAPPKAKNEYKFCVNQNADGMLIGSVSEYYGRFIVSLKLYTVYTRSFVWEDSIIFSHDELDASIEEVTRKLLITLSGNESSTVTVKADPPNTLVLINRSFAGRDSEFELEYPPGHVIVEASASDHHSLTFETELPPGSITNINIELKPLEYSDVEITGNLSGSVYHGSLYIGESPLTLRLPVNSVEYVELERTSSNKGRAVFMVPESDDMSSSLNLNTKYQPPKGKVDRARRDFYWIWGTTWVTGIAAWITYHTFTASNNAITYYYNETGGDYSQEFYDKNLKIYNISRAMGIVVAAAAVTDIFLIVRYVRISGKSNTTMRRLARNERKQEVIQDIIIENFEDDDTGSEEWDLVTE